MTLKISVAQLSHSPFPRLRVCMWQSFHYLRVIKALKRWDSVAFIMAASFVFISKPERLCKQNVKPVNSMLSGLLMLSR